MDRSMSRPPGPRESSDPAPPRRDTTDCGPIPGAAEEGPRRSRTGISRLPWQSRGRIGLLLLGLVVLPWLPIFGPPRHAKPTRRIPGVGDAPVLAFAFAPDGATISSLHWDWTVALRDTAGDVNAPSFLNHGGHVRALVFSPDGRSLAVGGDEPDILLYDVGAVGTRHPLGMPIRCINDLAFSPDGRTLAASSDLSNEILVWDLVAGRERARLRGHGSRVISLAFAPDGRSLASGSQSDGAILLWDLATSRPRRRLGVPPRPVFYLAYSPDGRWLASTCNFERPVRLWDLEGRRGERLIGSHSSASKPVAFSPDGRMLATAGDDGVVRLWDPATGAELHRVGGPDDRLTGVAFSPDGRLLAATGNDADIRLWDVAVILGARPGHDR